MAFAKGGLQLAPVCLTSPRACRTCARASWRVLSGGLGAWAEVPEFSDGLVLLYPGPKEGAGSGASPLVQKEGSDLSSSPQPCHIPQSPPPADLAPGPFPSLIHPLWPPSFCSSHVISQIHQAFPTSGPWPVFVPLPGIPAPPLCPWYPPAYHPGLSWIITSSERLS